MTTTKKKKTHPHSLSEKDVKKLIDAHHRERRGGFKARPILIQCLNEFGAPHRGVLTADHTSHLTVATLMTVEQGDKVVVYDDLSPDGPQSHSGYVEDIRAANRPSDTQLTMNVIYLRLDDE